MYPVIIRNISGHCRQSLKENCRLMWENKRSWDRHWRERRAFLYQRIPGSIYCKGIVLPDYCFLRHPGKCYLIKNRDIRNVALGIRAYTAGPRLHVNGDLHRKRRREALFSGILCGKRRNAERGVGNSGDGAAGGGGKTERHAHCNTFV